MSKVNAHTRLQMEITRLQALEKSQRVALSRQASELTNKLNPVTQLLSSISNMVNDKNNKRSLTSGGTDMLISLFTNKLLGGGKMGLISSVGALLLKNSTINAVSNNREKLYNWVHALRVKLKSDKPEPPKSNSEEPELEKN